MSVSDIEVSKESIDIGSRLANDCSIKERQRLQRHLDLVAIFLTSVVEQEIPEAISIWSYIRWSTFSKGSSKVEGVQIKG